MLDAGISSSSPYHADLPKQCTDPMEFIILFVLIVINGIFAVSEMAIV